MHYQILNETDSKFLEENANKITVKATGEDYYFMPYWFKKLEDGRWGVFYFDNLPEDVKETLKKARESNPRFWQTPEDEIK